MAGEQGMSWVNGEDWYTVLWPARRGTTEPQVYEYFLSVPGVFRAQTVEKRMGGGTVVTVDVAQKANRFPPGHVTKKNKKWAESFASLPVRGPRRS